MSEEEYRRLLEEFGLTKSTIMDRYDAVFHLVTAAKGAEEYYNLDNEARTETVEQAAALDDKIINAKYNKETLDKRITEYRNSKYEQN
jgi:hypothetical protein